MSSSNSSMEATNEKVLGSEVYTSELKSIQFLESHKPDKLKRVLIVSLVIAFSFMFLPWTQNIESRGSITSLSPQFRPQVVNSVIAGRIEKWYVGEGDLVKKGDTLLFLSEVKTEYFDPNLLAKTQDQINAKSGSIESYQGKQAALETQIAALESNQGVKMQQTRNKLMQLYFKVSADSIDYEVAKNNLSIADQQYRRYQELHAQQLVSTTELETRRMAYQNAQAKSVDAQNQLQISRNDVLINRAELLSVENDFRDKISKAQSELFATQSNQFEAEGQRSKLENAYANYDVRNGFYYITAPQDGYVTKAVRTGIGETVQEGEAVLSIMPDNMERAVEMYIEPMDLPLIHVGNKVRFIFDGWPAFVFSGWPNSSYGTFGGTIYAIDNFISDNGQYRALVVPDNTEQPWPHGLRVGTGANGIALLNDVPIWYEIWRRFNGFPPDYYAPEKAIDHDMKKD
ncbi:MAG: HlyD family secretion protein [Flavobacteriales bacterium]